MTQLKAKSSAASITIYTKRLPFLTPSLKPIEEEEQWTQPGHYFHLFLFKSKWNGHDTLMHIKLQNLQTKKKYHVQYMSLPRYTIFISLKENHIHSYGLKFLAKRRERWRFPHIFFQYMSLAKWLLNFRLLHT